MSAWPTHEFEYSGAELGEAASSYLGTPSPAVAPHEGRVIPDSNTPRVCDRYGMKLTMATLPGGGWNDVHNALLAQVCAMTHEAGFRTAKDPATRAPFQAHVPAAVLMRTGGSPGIVADAIVTMPLPESYAPQGRAARRQRRQRSRTATGRRLLDVKVVYGGHEAADYLAPRALRQQCDAVETRASAVNTEYQRHARAIDAMYNAPHHPVLDALAQFGPVRGLAFGQYSEWSSCVDAVVDTCADAISAARWRQLGARSQAECRGYVVSALRRRLGLVAARELARLRLNRVQYIGVDAASLRPGVRLAREVWERSHPADAPVDSVPCVTGDAFAMYQAHNVVALA